MESVVGPFFFWFVVNVQNEIEDVLENKNISTINEITGNIIGFIKIFSICNKIWLEWATIVIFWFIFVILLVCINKRNCSSLQGHSFVKWESKLYMPRQEPSLILKCIKTFMYLYQLKNKKWIRSRWAVLYLELEIGPKFIIPNFVELGTKLVPLRIDQSGPVRMIHFAHP